MGLSLYYFCNVSVSRKLLQNKSFYIFLKRRKYSNDSKITVTEKLETTVIITNWPPHHQLVSPSIYSPQQSPATEHLKTAFCTCHSPLKTPGGKCSKDLVKRTQEQLEVAPPGHTRDTMNIKIYNDSNTLGPTEQSNNPQVQTVMNE